MQSETQVENSEVIEKAAMLLRDTNVVIGCLQVLAHARKTNAPKDGPDYEAAANILNSTSLLVSLERAHNALAESLIQLLPEPEESKTKEMFVDETNFLGQ